MDEDAEVIEVSSSAQIVKEQSASMSSSGCSVEDSPPSPLWSPENMNEQQDDNEILEHMRTKIENKGNMLSRAWTELYSLLTHYQAELISKEGKTTLAEARLNNREQQLNFRNQSLTVEEEKAVIQEELRDKEAMLKKSEEELSKTKRLMVRLQADLRSRDKLLEDTRSESMRLEQKFMRTVAELGRKQTELVIKDELLARIQKKMAEESSKLNNEIGQLKLALALEQGSREQVSSVATMERASRTQVDDARAKSSKCTSRPTVPEIKSTSTSITSRLHLTSKVKVKQEIDPDPQPEEALPLDFFLRDPSTCMTNASHLQEIMTLRNFLSTPESVPSATASSSELSSATVEPTTFGTATISSDQILQSPGSDSAMAIDLSFSQINASASSKNALSQMQDYVEQLGQASTAKRLASSEKMRSVKKVEEPCKIEKPLKRPRQDSEANMSIPHGQFTPLHVPQIPRVHHALETVPPADKPYQCTLCPSVCSSKHSLLRHIRVVHGGEKPYKCELCDMRFGFLWNLKTHMRTHTGEKPFGCAQCGARYRQIGDLYRHQRLRNHGGERPFKCDICGKTFSQKWSLQQHIKSH